MFSRKDRTAFALAAGLAATALMLMIVDPVDNGFGVLTLYVAPPLLLAGLLLPLPAIVGFDNLARSRGALRFTNPEQLVGVGVGVSAFALYVSTLEPTASLWDCSEFIASAYKLEVPHTPGTPLSLLIGRLFSFLALGDVSRVAWSVNLMSACFSSLAVVVLFGIILHLTNTCNLRHHPRTLRIVAATAGSLCLAFSDTFWFSAVEAETYGPACFFLLLLVWLILTGKHNTGDNRVRRLTLIFYLAGLAYCIHPMSLLALPVLPLTWFVRKVTLKTLLISTLTGLAIVFMINRFVAIGIPQAAFALDRFLVNHLHLPFYSGAVVLGNLLVLLFSLLLKRYRQTRLYAWPLVFLLLGFTPYLMLFIRSNHNPPIDESNPENLAAIKAYMNREGYPTSPLLYGPYFDAHITDVASAGNAYYKGEHRYEIAGTLPQYRYDDRQTILPRMYSSDKAHTDTYRRWTGLKEGQRPSFTDNLKFLFAYQIGHMYLRYLMWNFAGRAGDIQNSDWLRPWQAQSQSPFSESRNQYWMIPFLLGILGAVMSARRAPRNFFTIALLFLINGIVLVLYLNSPPNEPRERDYIYVGSYVAFSVWIGLGVLYLGEWVSKVRYGLMVLCVGSMAVPFWMMWQNFDDHDRSARTFQIDNARNVLNSCAPKSILFTGGDNDTFPLWYLQEVEGFRTDVRVMVLSYMNTDWYINQLRRSYYDSGAFKMTLGQNDYRQYGANDVLYVDEMLHRSIDVSDFLRLLKQGHPALTRYARDGEVYHILPSRTLTLSAPKGGDPNDPKVPPVQLQVSGSYLGKNALAILDLIASNGWTRPVYFNFTSMNTLGLDLQAYLVQEGPVYRLTPQRHPGPDIYVDTERAWENLVENADYSNLRDPGVLFNYEDYYSRILVPVRQSFNTLARSFLEKGDTAMTERVLNAARAKLYAPHLRPSYNNIDAAEIALAIGNKEMSQSFSTAAFNYYSRRVEDARAFRREPDRLDSYLLDASSKLLVASGR